MRATFTGGEVGDDFCIMQVDTDDDAFASFAELSAVFSGLSRSEFEIIDINGDNRISSTEYYNAETQSVLDKN